ncbi:MAG: family transposase [Polaromonas sp.]|nr:family transposase [Polaromonas sp.]
MKRSRFSEEQIAYAPRLAESGTPVVDVCRQIGVSEATYYTWKKKFGDLGVSELKRLRMLEDENARQKTHRGRPDARQVDPVGGGTKKALKAVKRRELAAWECQERYQGKCAAVVPIGATAALGLAPKERGTRSKRAAPAYPAESPWTVHGSAICVCRSCSGVRAGRSAKSVSIGCTGSRACSFA